MHKPIPSLMIFLNKIAASLITVLVMLSVLGGCARQVTQLPAAVTDQNEGSNALNKPKDNKADGYRGIWYRLGRNYEYGDKYSGGLGTSIRPTTPARRWHLTRWTGSEWTTSVISETSHSYDMGSLHVESNYNGTSVWRLPYTMTEDWETPEEAGTETEKFKANGFVRYSDFGARGDGKTDDINAIAAAHAFANQRGLHVKADDDATYYISGKDRTAVIQTDTDFGTARFIIDDTDVQNIRSHVFWVGSTLQPIVIKGISSLERNQEKIDIQLPGTCIVTVTDSTVRRYIRYGLNQNNGTPQTDIFIVDKDGHVEMDTPIIWDFDQVTEITAVPIDESTLTITGGRFTTIANRAESRYTYYSRGIAVRRSKVILDGLEHHVTGEGDHGAPYGGFINISDCAYVTVQNTILTGRKTYMTIGRAGEPVHMGSYDISVNRALNISFVNCSQTNDINDSRYWGIMGSNYSKNLLYDNCTFSRFDAHMGVANATIRNSTLGHQGINAIGSGTFTLENSTIYGRNLINLRRDYGSTWEGEFHIRDCVFVPANRQPISASLIGGSYSGQHDFGYTCYMPKRITIENLHIDDSNHPEDYQGPAIFANFNPQMTDETFVEKFPYMITEEVFLKNVTTTSGLPLRLSDNLFMFKDVKVKAD